MRRTYVDILGDYYDRLDDYVDLNGSGIEEKFNESELRKMVYHRNDLG